MVAIPLISEDGSSTLSEYCFDLSVIDISLGDLAEFSCQYF